MYYIGICDDEKSTCAQIENMVYDFFEKKGIQVEVEVWYTGEELCKYLQKDMVDILFLDIQLVSTDGIEIGKYIRNGLRNMETSIIYISSESNYAMQLFEIQPLDFLIKPLYQNKIDAILMRALKTCELKNQMFEYYSKGIFFRVPFKDILYFNSQNKKINIVMKNDVIQFNGKIRDIVKHVPHNFTLIHQSYLINLDYIIECSYEVVKMYDGSLLNISQPYRKKVREKLKNYEWECIR
ncbi:MAG: LytTR family DNA-binding domain-containing protein [Hespellia sp.]|nr:LytTR family DNA-binding domain-containing protein [Hespellia sp.]